MATSVATRDGGRASIDDTTLEQFRTSIRGDVLTPANPGYADKPIYNAMHRHRPTLIVRCMGTADVADAVKFARGQGSSWLSAVAAIPWQATRAATAGWSSI